MSVRVRELLQLLKSLDPDAEVFVDDDGQSVEAVSELLESLPEVLE